MVKKITLGAGEKLIEAARKRARVEHTTLDDQFRRGLADDARHQERMQCYDQVIADPRGRVQVGRRLTRDEMNER